MKKIFVLLSAIWLGSSLFAQVDDDGATERPQKVVYNLIFNIAPDPFNIPLVGFVNLANGDFQSLQLGFVNTTFHDFHGAQISFVNSTFNDHYGLQMGFVNTTFAKSHHVQTGFINTAGSAQGAQIGFVNTSYKTLTGLQLGFINLARGKQLGAVKAEETLDGVQTGFVNATIGNAKGSQLGFVNLTSGKMKGSQLGFVNFADTVSGVPFGFLSIVRKGGYRAITLSVNEFYPVNLSFKIGVPKLYTFIQVGYNPNLDKRLATGGGFGTLLPISKSLYFNPEISSLTPLNYDHGMQISSLACNLSYQITPFLQISAGPSVTHAYFGKAETQFKPAYHFIDHKINDKNRLILSARAAIGITF